MNNNTRKVRNRGITSANLQRVKNSNPHYGFAVFAGRSHAEAVKHAEKIQANARKAAEEAEELHRRVRAAKAAWEEGAPKREAAAAAKEVKKQAAKTRTATRAVAAEAEARASGKAATGPRSRHPPVRYTPGGGGRTRKLY